MLVVALTEAVVNRFQHRVSHHVLGELLQLLRVAPDLVGLSYRLSSLVSQDIPAVELQNLIFSQF